MDKESGKFTWYKLSVRKIKNWLKVNPLFQKLLKNASKLLSGDVFAHGLGFIAMALTARSLGPEPYGILVLIQAYIAIIDKLVNFQSWQALIKYGSDALENNEVDRFKRLIKFGTTLDFGSALLGTIVAIFGAYFVGYWMGWESDIICMIMAYSSVIMFNLSGTPTAILRLFDKFGLFAIQRIIAGIVKVTGVLIAYLYGFGLLEFLIVYLLTEIVGYVILLFMGWRELSLRNISKVLRSKIGNIGDEYEGLWSYVWTTNFSGSVRMASRRLDTLVIGAILGTAATGMYEIAKKFANIVNKLSSPLYQAIYPDLAKLWSRDKKKDFVKLGVQAACFAGGAALIVWAIFLLLGDWIIYLSVGSDYAAAYPVLIWYLLAIVVEIFAFPLQPAMLAMGYPKNSFYIHIITTIIYFAALFPLLILIGISGAGIAYLIYYVTWTLIMVFVEFRVLNKGLIASDKL